MTTSLDLAITAIRSNRRDEGRQLLNLLIQENPNNEIAWLWMSSVVDNDQQRARCLYHVLAINPNNQAARRGLQLLGIVVSDSRPVKVPRDSQPIQIPKPVPPNTSFVPTDTQPLKPIPEPQIAATMVAAERRPFRLNPQEVVAELPFKPITKPFTTSPAEVETGAGASPPPSESVPVIQANTIPNPIIQHAPAQVNPDSNPVPVTAQPAMPAPQQMSPGGQFYPQHQFPGAQTPVQDTRPSQPVPVQQGPSQPVPVVHSNVTMGMPAYEQQPQYQQQPMAPIHSNATMMMPAPGQAVNPSEPVPVVHSNVTMGMPAYEQQPQYHQQPVTQNYAAHSNSTTMMPIGMNPFVAAAPNQAAMVDYRVANAMGYSAPGPNRATNDGDEDEEINILAVVIFGSLSVTALGGLGMLILLMFAT